MGHLHILSQSVKDFLDPWFESEALKVALATDGVIGTKGGPYTPGTAYVLLHHVMGGVGGKRGLWGFVRGGMGGVTQAMAASARSVGVEIRTGARVAKILVKDGRATGVALASGEEIRARVVASNADPKVTFLKLLEERELPADFLAAIRAVQNRRRLDEDQPGARRPAGLHLPARLHPRAASQNHHSHLPHARIH